MKCWVSLATIFPTHPYSKVCTSFPSIARNTCGQRQPILLMSKALKNSGKHRTFTRSWQTPSLTVLALRCCSDNLIQNLQKRAPLKRQRDSKLDSKCNFWGGRLRKAARVSKQSTAMYWLLGWRARAFDSPLALPKTSKDTSSGGDFSSPQPAPRSG